MRPNWPELTSSSSKNKDFFHVCVCMFTALKGHFFYNLFILKKLYLQKKSYEIISVHLLQRVKYLNKHAVILLCNTNKI